MSLPLLNGETDVQVSDATRRLEEIERLAEKANMVAGRIANVVEDSREQLRPLYNALRDLFGDSASPGANGGDPRLASLDRWEAVIRRLDGREAEVLRILVETGPKTNSQLAPLLKAHYSKATDATRKLAAKGFITKRGDTWALKE